MLARHPIPPRALAVATAAAKAAGRLIQFHLGRPQHISTKSSPIDLVTEVDRRVERAIRRAIRRAFPDHGFVGEEHAPTSRESPYQWFVDPIDGTTNFVHGLPHCAVSIALACRTQVVLGVVHDPARRELFTARRGHGARLNGRRLRVSTVARLGDSLLGTGFPTNIRKKPLAHFELFKQFQLTTHAVRRSGSAALNLAYVAAGRFDGVWEDNVSPWDLAAGWLLILEAGGRVTNYHNQPATLATRTVLATNGRIHAAMLRQIRKHLRRP